MSNACFNLDDLSTIAKNAFNKHTKELHFLSLTSFIIFVFSADLQLFFIAQEKLRCALNEPFNRIKSRRDHKETSQAGENSAKEKWKEKKIAQYKLVRNISTICMGKKYIGIIRNNWISRKNAQASADKRKWEKWENKYRWERGKRSLGYIFGVKKYLLLLIGRFETSWRREKIY